MASLPEPFLWREPHFSDLAAVAQLEALVFPDPWPEGLFATEVGQPNRFQRVVLAPSGALAAYLFAAWQVDDLHILKVATHPQYQGRGLATALLQAALEEAENKGGRSLTLEVRVSNRRAIELYRRLGYLIAGRRSRYYQDGEDAYVMSRPISRSLLDRFLFR
ncbi:MAG: ribosomal protein S18-alanine N-acetyltransferase [Thermoanaerobaculum sp.]|nr:ribosomal protein S18-alanine N-acetyltransferase [Thermoanaerobaculum sp.]